MAIWFPGTDGDELIFLDYAAQVLDVRLQAVIKLGLPRYMVAKKAAYKKKDIEAFLVADLAVPNTLLRELQEEHRQVQIRQKAHPSTRYKSAIGTLSPDEAKAARKASTANRKKAFTRDEVFGGWSSSLSRNKPVRPAVQMTESEAQEYEGMRARLREEMDGADLLSSEQMRRRQMKT